MTSEITECRICGNTQLESILNLGSQFLSGHFPRPGEKVDVAPLDLVRCIGGNETCGLVQLRHTYDLNLMYGKNYGYRSSLNKSMLEHLDQRRQQALRFVDCKPQDLVLDIGSNDCSLLKMYPETLTRVGIDPTSEKFKSYYPADVLRVADFFSAETFFKKVGSRKAKVITSIAMFYDLPTPAQFVADIAQVLDEDGVWLFEQSYLPTMCEQNSYDTICHEHLEYYSLKPILWMLEKAGLHLIDAEITAANGGSICLVAAKQAPKVKPPLLESLLEKEKEIHGPQGTQYFERFRQRVADQRDRLRETVISLQKEGRRIIGFGASTKGNVILQYCNLNREHLTAIIEVNADKFGCETPGTRIPIVSEAECRLQSTDTLLVLPWHFRSFFEKHLEGFIASGGSVLYPLPTVELVKK